MTRTEQLRAFWEERIPAASSFYLVDVARYTKGIVSRRTLQRRAADGTLRAFGGSDRALQHYRVLREDLLQFLCSLDVITGAEPPEPKPVSRRERKARRKARRQAASAAKPRPPRSPWFGAQQSLFDTE